eukprot:623625-Pleurochrysis_carterae.AAC.1
MRLAKLTGGVPNNGVVYLISSCQLIHNCARLTSSPVVDRRTWRDRPPQPMAAAAIGSPPFPLRQGLRKRPWGKAPH